MVTLHPPAHKRLLDIKSTKDGEVKFKASYVIGGQRDNLGHMMIHSSPTLKPSSIRLLLAFVALNGFKVWNSDLRQASTIRRTVQGRGFIRDPD